MKVHDDPSVDLLDFLLEPLLASQSNSAGGPTPQPTADAVSAIFSSSAYPDSMTLGEARKLLREKAPEGIDCPLCTRRVAVQNRPINATMLLCLRWLISASNEGDRWVHVPTEGPKWLQRTKQHTTLRWWGLIESGRQGRKKDPKAPGEGYWRPTEKGITFIKGEVSVDLRVVTFNDNVLGYTGPKVFGQDVMGEGFKFASVFEVPLEVIPAMVKERKGK